MAEKYTIQPGDFLISESSYNNNITYAIFEGKEIVSSTYTGATPDYSILVHYESHPYCYGGNSQPKLEIATKDTPCTHKIYIIENPSMWRKCTGQEKEIFLDILQDNGYFWDDETWSLVDLSTGEVVNSITMPKIEYNGTPCQIIADATIDFLMEKCKKDAAKIYMHDPPCYGTSPQTHIAGHPSYVHDSYGDWYD